MSFSLTPFFSLLLLFLFFLILGNQICVREAVDTELCFSPAFLFLNWSSLCSPGWPRAPILALPPVLVLQVSVTLPLWSWLSCTVSYACFFALEPLCRFPSDLALHILNSLPTLPASDHHLPPGNQVSIQVLLLPVWVDNLEVGFRKPTWCMLHSSSKCKEEGV